MGLVGSIMPWSTVLSSPINKSQQHQEKNSWERRELNFWVKSKYVTMWWGRKKMWLKSTEGDHTLLLPGWAASLGVARNWMFWCLLFRSIWMLRNKSKIPLHLLAVFNTQLMSFLKESNADSSLDEMLWEFKSCQQGFESGSHSVTRNGIKVVPSTSNKPWCHEKSPTVGKS